MKNSLLLIIFLLASFVFGGNAFSQSGADPAVENPQINPSPLVTIGDEFDISFDMKNNGTADITGADPSNKMGFTITVAKCAPSPLGSGVAVLSGDALNYFDVTWDAGLNTFFATQKTDVVIPFLSSAIPLSMHLEVTELSASTSIGANANIQPPGTSNPQPTDNDVASIFTFTTTILPVTGLALGALRNGADVNLQWQTISETNTKQFDLERSLDGQHFTYVATLKAAGNSQGKSTYKFTDKNMTASVVYYRVKLTDNNGKLNMSNVAVVRMANSGVVKVFPNPVGTHFFVRFDKAGKFSMQLVDVGGKTVYTRVVEAAGLGSTLRIERGNLAAGSYHMKVSDESGNSYITQLVFE